MLTFTLTKGLLVHTAKELECLIVLLKKKKNIFFKTFCSKWNIFKVKVSSYAPANVISQIACPGIHSSILAFPPPATLNIFYILPFKVIFLVLLAEMCFTKYVAKPQFLDRNRTMAESLWPEEPCSHGLDYNESLI